jgi:hypothetical protein
MDENDLRRHPGILNLPMTLDARAPWRPWKWDPGAQGTLDQSGLLRDRIWRYDKRPVCRQAPEPIFPHSKLRVLEDSSPRQGRRMTLQDGKPSDAD